MKVINNNVKKLFVGLAIILLMIPSEGCTKARRDVPIYQDELPKIHCEKCISCYKDLSKCQVADMPQPKYKRAKHIVGRASWYGPGFHGRKTASGQRFNKHSLTAAHRTLPLGSKVLITNLKNNESVVVEINDRGPFVKGRIIDLSQAAAQAIGIHGIEKVQITKLN